MSEILLYRPNRSEKWVALVMVIMSVVGFIFATVVSWIPLTLITSCLLWCAWSTYTGYSNIIAFGTTEIQAFAHKLDKRYPWTQFNNAYLGANFKGFCYMVLSSKKLNENEVRKLCNKASMSRDFLGDSDTFVFFC